MPTSDIYGCVAGSYNKDDKNIGAVLKDIVRHLSTRNWAMSWSIWSMALLDRIEAGLKD